MNLSPHLRTEEERRQGERWKAARARMAATPPKPVVASRETPAQYSATVAPMSWAIGQHVWVLHLPPLDVPKASPKATQDEPGRVPVRLIQEVVAAHFGVSTTDLLSARKARAVTWPRQVAMYLAKTLTLCSLPGIGRRFGRDHTTVLHAVGKVERLAETEPEVAALIAEITAKIEAVA